MKEVIRILSITPFFLRVVGKVNFGPPVFFKLTRRLMPTLDADLEKPPSQLLTAFSLSEGKEPKLACRSTLYQKNGTHHRTHHLLVK
jgi:hypothetical protein